MRLARIAFLRLIDDPHKETRNHDCASTDVLFYAAGGLVGALQCYAQILDIDSTIPAEDVCGLTPDLIEACCRVARSDSAALKLRRRMVELIATYVTVSAATSGISPEICEYIAEKGFFQLSVDLMRAWRDDSEHQCLDCTCGAGGKSYGAAYDCVVDSWGVISGHLSADDEAPRTDLITKTIESEVISELGYWTINLVGRAYEYDGMYVLSDHPEFCWIIRLNNKVPRRHLK